MTAEEQEILEFYRSGHSLADISYVYGHSIYMLKKFLAKEPTIALVGYIWRSLYPSGAVK